MQTNLDKRTYITACRRLPVSIDTARLQREVSDLPAELWGNVRAPVHRETQSLFLRGHAPILGIPDDSDQPELSRCPYVRELLYGLLSGTPGKCLLAALRPGGIVYPHMDAANDYFVRSFRVHVPVFTNALVRVFCNGRFFHMQAGEAWTLNNLAPHAVINDHASESRIHLIFDVFPSAAGIEAVAASPEEEGEDDPALYTRLCSQPPSGAQMQD